MATLTRQVLGEDGLTASYVAAGVSGDEVANLDGATFLHIKNGGGAPITVTVAEQISGNTVQDTSLGKLTKANATKTIANAAEAFFGPFKKAGFNDIDGNIQITYTAVTSVTIAALKLP
jgi:hypothetical protein